MVPMRTVPFRVVALVGLSDGVFPRAPRPLAFDLMARAPRPGDRTPRDDDRYLFLEALLSARAHLLITYVGHSITNNAELPPSVVVSELLDAIDAPRSPPRLRPARRRRRVRSSSITTRCNRSAPPRSAGRARWRASRARSTPVHALSAGRGERRAPFVPRRCRRRR